MTQLPKFKWPSAEEIAQMRPEGFEAIDVKKALMMKAAMKSLADGIPVSLTMDGRVLCTFFPDGSTDVPY